MTRENSYATLDAAGKVPLAQLDNAAAVPHTHAGADIASGTVADARIASTLARDSEVATAVTTHEGLADPHTGYVREADANWIDLTDGGASTLHSHAAGSGAPTDADYLVATAHAGLSAEIVVGATPGGELGGTWGSPTVDATHSGSTHAATQAAAEATAAAALTGHTGDTSDAHDASAVSFVPAGAIAATDVQAAIEELDTEKSASAHTHTHAATTGQGVDDHHARDHAINGSTHTGTLDDSQIPAGIARDAEVTAAISTHEGLADPHPGYLTPAEGNAAYEATGAVATHAGLADPHTGYRLESADHSHATTGLQGGTIAHSVTTGQTANDHHNQAHAINSADHTGTLDDAQIPSGIARDAEVAAGYQPLDSDLTAIAALTTTAFGRALLELADAAALGAAHSHSGSSTAYEPGSFTVATGNYAQMVKRLALTTTQRVTLQGTARLRIN